MIYRLYMYSTTAASENAPALRIVSSAVSKRFRPESIGESAMNYIKEFDAENVKNQIDAEQNGKCLVTVEYPPDRYEQIPYLYIRTSFELIREVMPKLHAVASANGLALYDAEKQKTFYNDILDDTFITLRMREKELKKIFSMKTNRYGAIKRLLLIMRYDTDAALLL